VREIISIRSACAGAQDYKKTVKQELARKKSQEVYIFYVCVERPLAGGFQLNMARVFVSRT